MDAHAAEGSASLRHRHAADAEPEDRGEIDAGGEESTGRKRASSGQDASVAAKGHRTRAQRVAASVREARRLISPYLWRGVLPCAIILGVAAATSAAGYKNMWGVRLVLFLVAFVVVRDAMVPCKLWDIGSRGQFGRRFFWMRFVFNAPILLGLGLGGLAIPQVMNLIEPELAVHVVHFREHWIPSSLASMALGVVAAYPVLVANQRLGGVGPARVMDPVRTTNPKAIWFQPSTRASMIFFVVAANYFEEVLYRGYVRGLCVTTFGMGTWEAILFSAMAFSMSHAWLAFVLTDVGLPILVFTFWEGAVCGVAEALWGVVPAAWCHGSAIYYITVQLNASLPYVWQFSKTAATVNSVVIWWFGYTDLSKLGV